MMDRANIPLIAAIAFLLLAGGGYVVMETTLLTSAPRCLGEGEEVIVNFEEEKKSQLSQKL